MRVNGRFFRALVVLGLVILLLLPGAAWGLDDPQERVIRLQTEDIVLTPGVLGTAGAPYAVLLLGRDLRRSEIDALWAGGVRLVSYLGDGAFIAGVDPGALTAALSAQYGIEAAAPWDAPNKAAPALRQGRAPDWAQEDGGLLKLLVLFFEDVDPDEMEAVLGRHTASYAPQSPPLLWAVEIDPSRLDALLQEPGIYMAQPGPAPFQPLLDQSRALIHADEVQQAQIGTDPPSIQYGGLTGKGIMLQVSESVWDGHPDFEDDEGQSRFHEDSPTSGADHGTSVAGIMGGGGVHSATLADTPYYGTMGRWRGMAPEASLYEGYYTGKTRLVDASNHSYVMSQNVYDLWVAVVDREIRGDSEAAWQWPQVWAAGNQGLLPSNGDDVGYYSMYAPAKNSIAVGSVNANDGSLSSHVSSLGPTFDGRIKPDVMAPGSKNHLPQSFDLFSGRMQLQFDYIRVYNGRTGSLDAGWEFPVGDAEGWFQTGQEWRIYDVSASGGYLTCNLGFWPEGGNVYPYGWKKGVDIETDPDHVVVIRYKASTPAGSAKAEGELWWHFGKDTGETGVDGVMRFPIVANGNWQVQEIRVGEWGQSGGAFGGWKGHIDALGMVPFSFAWPGIVSPAYFSKDDYYAYRSSQGTSEAAPAVTGSVALILQQFRDGLDIDVRNSPPLPSTVKAILIQTAEDLVHASAYPRDPDNPDTGEPVLYYEGPDFATGYGLVNVEAAVDLVKADPGPGAPARMIHEGEIDAGEEDRYEVLLTSGDVDRLGGELKFTLAWDDAEGSPATAQTSPKLVNDLDLTLIDPDGVTHLPWTLDPLPIAKCGGAGPGCGDPDPIDSEDIVPAKRAADHRNNVEMVQVSQPKPGRWQVVVKAHKLPEPLQSYSLVGNQPAQGEDWQSLYLPLVRRGEN